MSFKRIYKILFIFLLILFLFTISVEASDYDNVHQFEPYTNTSRES